MIIKLPNCRTDKENRLYTALLAEIRIQKILEEHDGGWYELETRGINLARLKKLSRHFRRMSDLERSEYVCRLAKNQELLEA